MPPTDDEDENMTEAEDASENEQVTAEDLGLSADTPQFLVDEHAATLDAFETWATDPMHDDDPNAADDPNE